ncbi:MAG: glycosyltransferase family 4 protein [Candidatus Aerophobetes bacterium]|nr:glycosyltransferase family 4 protein [Candidatus Aerophobetes bacterium]
MKKNMHILHLTPYMGQGGTERCILNLISQSLKRGYQVSLASPDGNGLKKVPGSVRICKLENWRISKPLGSASALKKVALSIGKEADIIQVHASAEMAYLMKKYLPQKPIIFTCHGYDTPLPRYFNYWIASKFLKKIDYSIVLNPVEREYFARAGIKKEKLAILPNGVEKKFFNFSFGKKNNDRVVGLVGRLVKRKNILWAIEAQAKYRLASKLLIVGDGPLRSKLERRVKRLGLGKEVIFLGHQEKIEKIYPLFSSLLVCSRNEAFPLIILEALAGGIPVFIPDWLPGVKKIFSSAPGIIVFQGVKDLKEKIERGDGRIERKKIQEFARSFLWENIFPEYEKLYRQVLNRD